MEGHLDIAISGKFMQQFPTWRRRLSYSLPLLWLAFVSFFQSFWLIPRLHPGLVGSRLVSSYLLSGAGVTCWQSPWDLSFSTSSGRSTARVRVRLTLNTIELVFTRPCLEGHAYINAWAKYMECCPKLEKWLFFILVTVLAAVAFTIVTILIDPGVEFNPGPSSTFDSLAEKSRMKCIQNASRVLARVASHRFSSSLAKNWTSSPVAWTWRFL